MKKAQMIHARCAGLFWPEGSQDALPEPPILIEVYADTVCISQGGVDININRDQWRDFFAAVREVVKRADEQDALEFEVKMRTVKHA